VALMDDRRELVMRAGDLFYIPPGHNSWVVGEEPYVSLHILGGESYAADPAATT
jgi:quercetin dioxygenase-like cupin family protein